MGTKTHWRARGRAFSEDAEAVQDVEAQVDGSPQVPSKPVALAPLDDSDFLDFVVAGASVAGEFRCSDCGYGAVVRRTLPPCPMCGGTVWESRAPRSAS